MQEKIALFGGSFNPIHNGHLWIAQATVNELALDKVYFIPNTQSPFKVDTPAFNIKQRLDMLNLALRKNPLFEISEFELENEDSPSFTVDTINHFGTTHPKAKIYFIVGSDNLAKLHLWKDIETILQKSIFVVHKRDKFIIPYNSISLIKKYESSFVFLNSPTLHISSTYIKLLIKEKKSFKYLVPQKVYDYIMENNLYV